MMLINLTAIMHLATDPQYQHQDAATQLMNYLKRISRSPPFPIYITTDKLMLAYELA
jgi:hypothetical protein